MNNIWEATLLFGSKYEQGKHTCKQLQVFYISFLYHKHLELLATVNAEINKIAAWNLFHIYHWLKELNLLQIANVVDAHAATLTKRTERDAFFLNTQNIVQLVQR